MITHDQKMSRPVWAKRTISSWLVGAGADHVEAGMGFVPAEIARAPIAEKAAPIRTGEVRATGGGDCTVDGKPPAEEDGVSVALGAGMATWSGSDWTLSKVDFREVYFTHAGGFDQSLLGKEAPNWLGRFNTRRLDADGSWDEELVGKNTCVHLPSKDWPRFVRAAKSALEG